MRVESSGYVAGFNNDLASVSAVAAMIQQRVRLDCRPAHTARVLRPDLVQGTCTYEFEENPEFHR